MDGEPCILARGRIRVADVERWGEQLAATGRAATKIAFVDLTRCPYLPSMALPPLIQLHQDMQDAGKDVVVAVGADLMEIFRTLRLESHLRITADMTEARALARAIRG